jgi:hypothetical protein
MCNDAYPVEERLVSSHEVRALLEIINCPRAATVVQNPKLSVPIS